MKELEKPGRDPRQAFTTATFKEGVETIGDLKTDMILEGVVTNVATFGAFATLDWSASRWPRAHLSPI